MWRMVVRFVVVVVLTIVFADGRAKAQCPGGICPMPQSYGGYSGGQGYYSSPWAGNSCNGGFYGGQGYYSAPQPRFRFEADFDSPQQPYYAPPQQPYYAPQAGVRVYIQQQPAHQPRVIRERFVQRYR